MNAGKIIVVVGAIAVANAAMAVINPFTPQLSLTTVPKLTTTTTTIKTVTTAPLALSSTTVVVRSGYTLPTGTPTSKRRRGWR